MTGLVIRDSERAAGTLPVASLQYAAGAPRDRVLSLRESVTWTGLANAVYLISQYGMLVGTARLGTPTLVGELGLAQAIATPVFVFAQMQLRQVQVTDLRGAARFGDYLSTRAYTTLAALAVVGGMAAVMADPAGRAVLLAVALFKAFESLSDIAYGDLQRHDRLDLVAASLVPKALASVVAFMLTLWATQHLALALAAGALVLAAFLVLVDLPLQRRVARRMQHPGAPWTHRAPVVWLLVRTAMPLAVASGLGSLSSNIPRYFLDASQGKAAVALYSLALGPVSLVGLLTGSISQATLKRVGEFFQTGNAAGFRALAARLTVAQTLPGGALALLFWAAGPRLLTTFFGPAYATAGPVFAVIALAVAVGGLSAFGSSVLIGGRQFRLQLASVVVGLVVQIPLCALLIPSHGTMAAAWLELLRYVVCTLYLTIAGSIVFRRHLTDLVRHAP